MRFRGWGTSHPDNWRNYVYGRTLAFYITGAVVIGLLFVLLSRIPAKSTVFPVSPPEQAWNACAQAAQDELGIPPADLPAYRRSYVKILAEDHYQVELEAAQSGVTYQCAVERASDGSWQVKSLQAD